MASFAFQFGIKEWLRENASRVDFLGDTIKCMLVKSGYSPNRDNHFIDDGGANDPVDHEITVGGYVRQTLASKTVAVNDTSDRVEADAADSTFTSLAAGETISTAVIFKDTGVATTSTMLCQLDPADLPTNGSSVAVQYASTGILNFNC